MKINYDRLNSVRAHNFSRSVDFHDVIKMLLVRILRRNNKNSIIYTEYNPESTNESYPDIYMRTKKGEVYIYEIQKEVTTEWKNQIMERYKDKKLVIIPTKNLPTEFNELREELEKWA